MFFFFGDSDAKFLAVYSKEASCQRQTGIMLFVRLEVANFYVEKNRKNFDLDRFLVFLTAQAVIRLLSTTSINL